MSNLSKASTVQDSHLKNGADSQHQNPISWFIFGLMASVTFIGILSELMPSGILPQMTAGLGIEQTQVGFWSVYTRWHQRFSLFRLLV